MQGPHRPVQAWMPLPIQSRPAVALLRWICRTTTTTSRAASLSGSLHPKGQTFHLPSLPRRTLGLSALCRLEFRSTIRIRRAKMPPRAVLSEATVFMQTPLQGRRWFGFQECHLLQGLEEDRVQHSTEAPPWSPWNFFGRPLRRRSHSCLCLRYLGALQPKQPLQRPRGRVLFSRFPRFSPAVRAGHASMHEIFGERRGSSGSYAR